MKYSGEEPSTSSSTSSAGLRSSPSCQSLDTRINNMSFNAADGSLEEGECVTHVDDSTMEQDDNLENFEDSIMNYDGEQR